MLTIVLGLGLLWTNAVFAATKTVVLSNSGFTPSVTTIGVGDSVFFTNIEGYHNVTGYNPASEPFCGTTVRGPGPMCTVTFTKAGVYRFRCVPHSSGSGTIFSGMVGSITVTSPPAPPMVVITNPVNNSLFASLAAVTVGGYATVTGATVTNIQFFANDALVSSSTSSPFFVNASNLAAGDYSLTARAMDSRGVNGTSAPVVIRLIDQPLLVTQPGTSGPIQFSFNTVTGLNYIVQGSTDQFTNWSGLVTNRATTTNHAYAETWDAGPIRFYRVIVQP
ncbi:MAG: hypothetical protein KIS67_21930 [Verrucomicrobiae bacterium]|nr:hypothetical protein [Verrucomicrobiae bacterium]